MKNILVKLTMAAIATFIVSGGAMAVAPYPFDNYSAVAGVITDNSVGGCAAGYSCVDLEANDLGIMQRTITDTGTGVSYLQTVITESNATGTATALDFTTEAFVFAAGINANNIALKQHINQTGMAMTVFIQENAFETGADVSDPNSSGDGVHLNLDQTIDLGGADFGQFIQNGQNGNVQQIVNQRIDGQRATYRVVSGASFAPTVAGSLGDGTFENGAIAYDPGDALSVWWVAMDQSNNQQFGLQDYHNITQATETSYDGNVGQLMGQWVDNGPWAWDTTFFGNAPNPPPTVPEFP